MMYLLEEFRTKVLIPAFQDLGAIITNGWFILLAAVVIWGSLMYFMITHA